MDLGGVISRAGVGSAAYGAAQDAQIARQEALERLRQFRLQTKQTQIDMDAAVVDEHIVHFKICLFGLFLFGIFDKSIA